jgi:hypothetical protein
MNSHKFNASISTTSTKHTLDSENQSINSIPSRCPDLILDSSSGVFTSAKSPIDLIANLSSLPIPIRSLDFSPRTEKALGSHLDATIGTKVRTNGNSTVASGKGELKAGNVRDSLKQSLTTTKVGHMGYIIAPRIDSEVAVGELAGGFGGLVSEGAVEMVSGLLNEKKS